MAHQHAVVLQAEVELLTGDRRAFREEEVRLALQHMEAELLQRRPRPCTIRTDLRTVCFEVRRIPERLHRTLHRDAVHVVRVVRVPERLHVLNQRRIADREADPCARHTAGLREGLRHEQILIFLRERHRTDRLVREIHISLIDHHDVVCIRLTEPCDRVERNRNPGRCIRVRDHDILPDACMTPVRRRRPEIIRELDREVRPQRLQLGRHLIQLRDHLIEAVSDVRKREAVLAEGHERVVQALIRAVADEYIRHIHLKAFAELGLQRLQLRVRVEPEVHRLGSIDRRDHPRCRRKRRLVRV